MIRIEQEDEGKEGRFVIYEGDDFAGEMTYTWAVEDKFIIDHTGVPDEHNSKGYGKKLVEASIEFARDKGVRILPLCPFAKAYMDKHREYDDARF